MRDKDASALEREADEQLDARLRLMREHHDLRVALGQLLSIAGFPITDRQKVIFDNAYAALRAARWE